MCSLKAFGPIWVLIILLVNLTQGVTNSTDGIESNIDGQNDTSIPSPTKIAGVSPALPTTNETVAPPTYVVKSTNGQPCLLATFNISIRVSYFITAAKSERKYVAFKDIKVPEVQDTLTSVCGENQSSLILEWGNSTFILNMTFMSHGKSEDSVHTNWTIDSVAFSYNLSNFQVFPGASEDDFQTDERDGLDLFNTMIGHTKECDSPIKAKLEKGEIGSYVNFEYVKLAAFNLTSETFPKETEECQVKMPSIRDEDIMVPLIIACALSFVIIVVVVAYAISRKVQEARDQSQYKPMP